jgi:hypothetical protein
MSTQAVLIPKGAFTDDAVEKLLVGGFLVHAVSGALNPHRAGRRLVTKATAAALTLAAPTAGADDGLYIRVISTTAAAHTLTATGLYQDGAGNVNLATFAAQIGASIDLMAYQGKWYVLRLQGVTMS